MFSNIILRDFDREMTRHGVPLVRYADDFIILADSEIECRKADALARHLLSLLELKLPSLGPAESKTYIARPDEEIDFLGLALASDGLGSYKLVVTPKQMDKVVRSLNQLKDVNQLVQQGVDITSLVRTVENKIGGYLGAYSDAQNAEDLYKMLENCRREILRSVYVKAFGEASVSALPPNMRKVLCIN
jgi:hypothetical protein